MISFIALTKARFAAIEISILSELKPLSRNLRSWLLDELKASAMISPEALIRLTLTV